MAGLAWFGAVVDAPWLRQSLFHSSPSLRVQVVAPVERATACLTLFVVMAGLLRPMP
jgi:hypothetical protein